MSARAVSFTFHPPQSYRLFSPATEAISIVLVSPLSLSLSFPLALSTSSQRKWIYARNGFRGCMRNVGAPPVAMLPPRLAAAAPSLTLFLSSRLSLVLSAARRRPRRIRELGNRRQMVFRAVGPCGRAAVGRLIGAVTRVTDLARIFSQEGWKIGGQPPRGCWMTAVEE